MRIVFFLCLSLAVLAQDLEARRRLSAAYRSLVAVQQAPRFVRPGQPRDQRARKIKLELNEITSDEPEILTTVAELKEIASILQQCTDDYCDAQVPPGNKSLAAQATQRIRDAGVRLQGLRVSIPVVLQGDVGGYDPAVQGYKPGIRFSDSTPAPPPTPPAEPTNDNVTPPRLSGGGPPLPQGPQRFDLGGDGVRIDWTAWVREVHERLRPLHALAVQKGVPVSLTYDVCRMYNGTYQIRNVRLDTPAAASPAQQDLYRVFMQLQVPPFPTGSRVTRVRKKVMLGRGHHESLDAVPDEFYYN